MLPPVRMHSSIPVDSTNTYAFSVIRLVRFLLERIAQFDRMPKVIVTATSAMTMVYFWKKAERFIR